MLGLREGEEEGFDFVVLGLEILLTLTGTVQTRGTHCMLDLTNDALALQLLLPLLALIFLMG